MPDAPHKVVVNDEAYLPERHVVKSLAAVYASCPIAIAKLCDEHLDPSGRLLGLVRSAAFVNASQRREEGHG